MSRLPRPSVRFQVGLAVCAVTAIGAAVFLDGYPPAVFYWLLGASGLAFIFYGKDKYAALHDRWRVREGTLHLLAVAGGWPGAAIAQRLFNHKTSKRPFRVIFWLTVSINCSLIGWTFTEGGRSFLQEGLFAAEALFSAMPIPLN